MWYSDGVNNTARVKRRKVEEMIRDELLIVHNQPGQPNTYQRTNMDTSNIDATISTHDLERKIRNWTVRTDVTDSDHRLITFTVLSNRDIADNQTREKLRFNVDKADWGGFKEKLTTEVQNYKQNGTIDEGVRSITDAINKAARVSIPKTGNKRSTNLPP